MTGPGLLSPGARRRACLDLDLRQVHGFPPPARFAGLELVERPLQIAKQGGLIATQLRQIVAVRQELEAFEHFPLGAHPCL